MLGLRPKPHAGLCHTPARGTLLGWGFAPNPMWGSAPHPPAGNSSPAPPNNYAVCSVVQEALKGSTKRRTIAVGNSRTRTQRSRKTPKLRVRVPARVRGVTPRGRFGRQPNTKRAQKPPSGGLFSFYVGSLPQTPCGALPHTPGRELVPGTPKQLCRLFGGAGGVKRQHKTPDYCRRQ